MAVETPPAPRRRRRPRKEIVGEILKAAAEEFKRCGFADARTANIARNAGVTEAQLYRYFESKSQLFKEAVFEPLDRHLAHFAASYGPDEMGYPYTTDLQHFIRENIDTLRSLIVVEAYRNGGAEGVGQIDALRTYFNRGASIMAKFDGPPPKVPPQLMVRVSFATVLACVLFKDWLFPPDVADDAAITSAINDFVMYGIRVGEDPD